MFDYDAQFSPYIVQYLIDLPNVALLLVHRVRQWANIKPALGKYLVD